MIVFKDTDGNPVTNVLLTLGRSESVILTEEVPCIAHRSLRCTAAVGVTVEARLNGTMPWTDLTAGGIIDTTPYAPLDTLFDFRITAGGSLQRISFNLVVQ